MKEHTTKDKKKHESCKEQIAQIGNCDTFKDRIALLETAVEESKLCRQLFASNFHLQKN